MMLAIDASTKSCGIAVFTDSGELVHYDCLKASSTDVIKRIYKITLGIQNVIKEYNITNIVMEQVIPPSDHSQAYNLTIAKALFWLQASINFMVHDRYENIQIKYVTSSGWRSICKIKTGPGVKRDALKKKDIQFVKDKYGIDANDDICDAICIGYSQFAKVAMQKYGDFIR